MFASDDPLVDRNVEKATIAQRIETVQRQEGQSRQIFQFHGIFGIGKTALLLALEKLFEGAGIAHAYVDLSQFPETSAHLYIIRALVNQLGDATVKNDAIGAKIRQYEEFAGQLEAMGVLTQAYPNSTDPRPRLEAEIEEEFVRYLRAILESTPVVLLLDKTECITQGTEDLGGRNPVREWLNRLYTSTHLDQRLTVVMGGRDEVPGWNRRNSAIRAENPQELREFGLEDTKEQWRRISTGAPYESLHEALAGFVHAFTSGHPYSNVCIEKALRQSQKHLSDTCGTTTSTSSLDWASIFKEAARSMLEDWLHGSPERQELEHFVRAMAPFRRFDRDMALSISVQLSPTLANLDRRQVSGYLALLLGLTLLRKEKTRLFWIQPPVRRLVTEDMKRNAAAEYKRASEIALDYYRGLLFEAAEDPYSSYYFRYAVVELLYHEAELLMLSGAVSESELCEALSDQLRDALGVFYSTDCHDSYAEMLAELTREVKQDEELKATVGESAHDSLLLKLAEFRSAPPEPRYHGVFLSYNTKDRETVDDIAAHLLAGGARPWYDKQMERFAPWLEEMEKAAKRSRVGAVLVGAHGLGPYQKLEIPILIAQFKRRRMPIGLVLLPGCPDDAPVPETLKEFTWIDYRSRDQKSLDQLIHLIANKRRTPRGS